MRDTGVDPAAHDRAAWDTYVQEGDEWSRPVSAAYPTCGTPARRQRES
ncbi:hypothetical protein [Streptomyces sp. NPDC058667]